MNDCCDATLCNGIMRLLKVPAIINTILADASKDEYLHNFEASLSNATLKDIAFAHAWKIANEN